MYSKLLNFSTFLAGKLLVHNQVNEGSMAVEELFNQTRGMTFDNNDKMSTKMSKAVKLVCGMNYNVPLPSTDGNLKKCLPKYKTKEVDKADDEMNVIKADATAGVSDDCAPRTIFKCEGGGYYNLLSPCQKVIWWTSVKSSKIESRNAKVENEYLFLCEVNENGVLAQSSLCDEKLGEGYSWIKGYIDDSFKQDLIKEEISEILLVSPKCLSRSDLHNYVVSYSSFEMFGQALLNLWTFTRLFQVLNAISMIIQMFLVGEGYDGSNDMSASDLNSCTSIFTLLEDEKSINPK